jgi:hypothetical protein
MGSGGNESKSKGRGGIEIKTNYAWAAGIIDGEGHVRFDKTGSLPYKGKSYNSRMVRLSIHQKDRRLLDRFQALVGGGHIYAELAQGKFRIFQFQMSKARDVIRTCVSVWPYLGPVKRLQVANALVSYAKYKSVPRGKH